MQIVNTNMQREAVSRYILLMLIYTILVSSRDIRQASEGSQHVNQSFKQFVDFFSLVDNMTNSSTFHLHNSTVVTSGSSLPADKESANTTVIHQLGNSTVTHANNAKDDHRSAKSGYDGPIDRNDNFWGAAKENPPKYVGEYSLPIKDRQETVEDIFRREKLPEIQKVLASGDEKEIKKLIAETKEDPFTLLPTPIKYSQIIAGDVYFDFLTKAVTWFLVVSLLLPAAVPMLTLLMMVAEMLALWLLPDVPETPVVPAVPTVPDVLDGVDGLDADGLDGLDGLS